MQSPTKPNASNASSQQPPQALPERTGVDGAVRSFSDLTPQERESHRQKVGLRAEAILMQFWRDDATPDALRALEVEGWMDVLENCSHSEIRMAWATYQRTGPRTDRGRLCKPDAGALHRIVMAERPKPVLVRTAPEQERRAPPCTPEAAARIMREVFGEDRAELGPLAKKMPGGE